MKRLRALRYMVDFLLSSLLRQKGKNSILLFAYSAIIFVTASIIIYTESISTLTLNALSSAPEITVQNMVAGRHDLIPVGTAEQLHSIRGVQSAEPRFWGYYYDSATGANLTLIADTAVAQGTVSIGDSVSRVRQAFAGDYLSLRSATGDVMSLKVFEVLTKATDLMTADLALVHPADFTTLTGMPEGFATDIVLSVRNPREINTIAEKIVQKYPRFRPVTRPEILRTYSSVFSWRGSLLTAVASLSVLAFLFLAWDKATGISAQEKYEIGILKATGWDTADVLTLKMTEGVLISLTAYTAGLLSACIHVFLLDGTLIGSVLKGWSVIYPSFSPPFALPTGTLVSLFFLTVVPYTAATLYPAWKAASLDPDSVMR